MCKEMPEILNGQQQTESVLVQLIWEKTSKQFDVFFDQVAEYDEPNSDPFPATWR